MGADRYHPKMSLVRAVLVQSLWNQILVKGITNTSRGLGHAFISIKCMRLFKSSESALSHLSVGSQSRCEAHSVQVVASVS